MTGAGDANPQEPMGAGSIGGGCGGPILGVLVIVATVAVFAAILVPSGLAAKEALESAIPLANQVKTQIISGDTEAAKATVAELGALIAEARGETDSDVWKGARMGASR